MSEPNWAEVGTLLFTLVAGSVGLWQYVKSQRWKQLEFVVEQVQQMESNPRVENALFILDWNERTIDLYPHHEDPKRRFVNVNDAMLYRALATCQEDTKANFSNDEAEVRDCFDSFFAYLQRFDQFIEERLVREEDFRPYLRYWLKLIGDRTEWGKKDNKDELVMLQLWDFLIEYEYSDAIRLFGRCGYRISITEEERSRLERTFTLKENPHSLSQGPDVLS